MRKITIILTMVIGLAVAGSASAVSITLIDQAAGDFRIQSITDLTIDGTIYDVAFSHEISFNDLPSPAITFTSLASALIAHNAITDALNAALIVPTIPIVAQTKLQLLPFEITSPIGVRTTATDFVSNVTPLQFTNVNAVGITTKVNILGDEQAFLTFTPIPEPSTLLLLASGLAGLGFFKRRRKEFP